MWPVIALGVVYGTKSTLTADNDAWSLGLGSIVPTAQATRREDGHIARFLLSLSDVKSALQENQVLQDRWLPTLRAEIRRHTPNFSKFRGIGTASPIAPSSTPHFASRVIAPPPAHWP